jgi:hypothetical protein
MFSESVGFAGPLADLLDEGSFGFHLDGGSSIGKTAALVAAGSVWGGGGPLGFAYSWRTTDNGAEGMFMSAAVPPQSKPKPLSALELADDRSILGNASQVGRAICTGYVSPSRRAATERVTGMLRPTRFFIEFHLTRERIGGYWAEKLRSWITKNLPLPPVSR